jgi:ribosomal protein S20
MSDTEFKRIFKMISDLKENSNRYMTTPINQVKNTVDSISSRQDKAEERISEMEDKFEEIVYSITIKKNKSNHKNPWGRRSS